jgi:hypothetical protein
MASSCDSGPLGFAALSDVAGRPASGPANGFHSRVLSSRVSFAKPGPLSLASLRREIKTGRFQQFQPALVLTGAQAWGAQLWYSGFIRRPFASSASAYLPQVQDLPTVERGSGDAEMAAGPCDRPTDTRIFSPGPIFELLLHQPVSRGAL